MGRTEESKDIVEKEFVAFPDIAADVINVLLRKAGYVGGIYREQYEHKTQGIFTVIEFVLYWGDAGCFREIGMLIQMLLDGGRNEDLRRALSDQSYREQLYMEAEI